MQIERRNKDWKAIYNHFVTKDKTSKSPSKNAIGVEPAKDEETKFDAIIWLGDFNYRVNGVIGAV
jgi:hypothetical protein